MASITKKPGSPYYYACFTDANGRQMKRSTKSQNRNTAMRMAIDLEEVARGKKTVAQMRRILDDLGREVGVELVERCSVSAYVERFLKRKRGEVGAKTLVFYSGKLGNFLRFLGERCDDSLSTIGKHDIAAFRDFEAERVRAKTVNHGLKALRSLFGEARADGLIDTDPTVGVKVLAEGEDRARRPFTLEEIRRVLALCKNEWKTLVLLGLYTGQRLGDLTRLTWGMVDMERRVLAFQTGKTGRTVVVPIASPLFSRLSSLPDRAGHVLPAMSLLAATTISTKFGELLHKAGLRGSTREDKGTGRSGSRARNPLSFHSLRHTAVSWLKSAGVSAPVVEDLVGHDSIEVSRSYTRIDDAAKRAALDLLPDVG